MRAAATLLLVLAAAPAAAGVSRDAIDLINVALSPEHASFLVGSISYMASDAEVEAFLKLTRDEEAVAFIERFWEKRDPDPGVPGNPAREQAERRSEEADRRFSEAGVSGRRTDRGSIFVLHGEPEAIDHEPSPLYGEPPLEHWRYPADAPVGLDGKRPARLYRFVKRGDVTSFYIPGRPGRYTDRGPRPPSGGGR